MKFLFLLLLTVAHTAAKAADYVPRITCGVVKADSWTMGNNREGIYQMALQPGAQLTPLKEGRDVFAAPLGGAVYVGDTMYGIHFKAEWDPYDQAQTYTIYSVAYDMQTWTRTKGLALNSMYGNLISSCGITHDPVTDLNFGIFYNFNMSYQVINRKLATIDFEDTEKSGAPKKSIIGIVETPFAAIAANENGFLYGVGQDGYLYIIDKVVSDDNTYVSVYPIGDLGIADISTNPSTMAFDPRTGKLYWAYVTTKGKSLLYEISYAIGQVKATKLLDVPDNSYLVNMYIAPMETDDDAPAAPTALTAQFQGEQTTGTISFTMPTTTYSGDPLSGTLDYIIYAEDSEGPDVVAEGEAEAGAEVSVQGTVNTAGDIVELTVRAKNAVDEGASARTKLYIGRDTPLPVSSLKLTYNPDTEYAKLVWDAPTKGTHGKQLTEANLAYNVVRMPDSVVVAEGLRLPAFGEQITSDQELKSYYYTVVVQNGKHLSDTATSNRVVVGQALVPPFDDDFTSQERFSRFTVVDANDDGTQWKRYHRVYEYSGTIADYAQMYAHSQHADDDYLLTPPLRLQKGGRYQLSFTAKKEYGDKKYDQRLRVLVGMGDDLADYEVVIDTLDIDDVNFTKFETELLIREDGIYQIAFHAVSNAGSGPLDIDEMHLAASLVPTAPAAVTDALVTPDATGLLAATLTCTAPANNLRGEPLQAISYIDVTDQQTEQVVGTIANPQPGKPCIIELKNLQNGVRTFTIVAWSDGHEGAKATATAFIGQDIPLPPTDVALADVDGEALLTWKAPAQGINGLLLNQELLKYNLYSLADDGYADLLRRDISSPYHTGVKTAEGDQQLLYYVVDAESTGGLSELVASSSLVIGKPYELPFEEHFLDNATQFVWMEGDYADWNVGITNELSSDGDDCALVFVPNRADYAFFNLGKVALGVAEHPVLFFDYYALPAPTPATLGIAVLPAPQQQAVTLKEINLQQETEQKWKRVEIDLQQFLAADYVIVKFAMASLSSVENPVPIVIDNIRIADADKDGIAEGGRMRYAPTAPVYDMQGRRVQHAAKRGLYIQNGRKIMVSE